MVKPQKMPIAAMQFRHWMIGRFRSSSNVSVVTGCKPTTRRYTTKLVDCPTAAIHKLYRGSFLSLQCCSCTKSIQLQRRAWDNDRFSTKIAAFSSASTSVVITPPMPTPDKTSSEGNPNRSWDQKLENILNAPIGTLQYADKDRMQKAIHSLCQQRMDGYSSLNSVRAAERVLRRLLEEAAAADDAAAARVSIEVWSGLIHGYAHINRTECTKTSANIVPFLKARDLLQEMVSLHKKNPTLHPAPTEYHYSTVLFACANCSALSSNNSEELKRSNQAIATAEAVLESLEGVNSMFQSTSSMYNNLILAHANRAAFVYGAATAAENWLLRLSKRTALDNGTHSTVQLDTKTFNIVLRAWSDSPEQHGAIRAEQVLQLMLDLSQSTEGIHIHPNALSFGTVIDAYGKRGCGDQSQRILDMAIKYFNTGSNAFPKLDDTDTPIRNRLVEATSVDLTQCWSAACFAWANSKDVQAPERIHALIQQSQQPFGRKFEIRPCQAMYAACINAYLQGKHPERVERADQILRKLVEDCKRRPNDQRDAQPTTKTFEAVLNAWSSYSGGIQTGKDEYSSLLYAAEQSTSLLLMMVELSESQGWLCAPTTDTLEMCILHLTKTCRSLLQAATTSQFSRYPNSFDPSYALPTIETSEISNQKLKDAAMMAALKAVELLDLGEARKLTRFQTYKYVINRLCDIEHTDCVYEAVNILRRFERESRQRDLEWPQSVIGLYNSVALALGRVGTNESAELAHNILKGLSTEGKYRVAIDIKLLSSVVLAFKKVPSDRSSKAVFEIFDYARTLDSDSNSNVKLDSLFCEFVLRIMADSRVGDRSSAGHACDVLTYMLTLHFGNRAGIEPTTGCFDACIETLIRFDETKYLLYTAKLLKSLIQKYEEKSLKSLPSPVIFLRIARACRKLDSPKMIALADEIGREVGRLGLLEETKEPRHQQQLKSK